MRQSSSVRPFPTTGLQRTTERALFTTTYAQITSPWFFPPATGTQQSTEHKFADSRHRHANKRGSPPALQIPRAQDRARDREGDAGAPDSKQRHVLASPGRKQQTHKQKPKSNPSPWRGKEKNLQITYLVTHLLACLFLTTTGEGKGK